MKIKLNACPLCGGKAGLSAFTGNDDELSAYTFCKDCGAHSGMYHEIELAANAWNSRVYSEQEVQTIRNAYAGEYE